MSQTRPYRTAMRRTSLSRPVALTVDDGLIRQDRTFFRLRLRATATICCGCTRWSIAVFGWDPAFFPDENRTPADVVNLGHVVNVIEDPDERTVVLAAAWSLARKLLIVLARRDWEATDVALDFQGVGIVTGKRTFLKFFTQEELRAWIERVLDRRAIAAALDSSTSSGTTPRNSRFAVNRIATAVASHRAVPGTRRRSQGRNRAAPCVRDGAAGTLPGVR